MEKKSVRDGHKWGVGELEETQREDYYALKISHKPQIGFIKLKFCNIRSWSR